MNQPAPAQLNQQDRPGPSAAPTNQDRDVPIQMEEGEIDSERDQDPSVLVVSTVKRARSWDQNCPKRENGTCSKITAWEENNWNLEQAVC